jgi:hypothetical protein
MDSKWIVGLIGLIVGLVIAGGIGIGLEAGDDDDDDEHDGGAAFVCGDIDTSTLGSIVVVTSPAAGETVGDSFTLEGCAAAFEATVNYRVTDHGGAVLAEGFATADQPDIGISGEFSTTVDLGATEPGRLSLDVFEPDVSEGEGGVPPRHLLPIFSD